VKCMVMASEMQISHVVVNNVAGLVLLLEMNTLVLRFRHVVQGEGLHGVGL